MIRRNNNNANNNKNITNDTSLEIMNYLIQKLEARQKKVLKFKNLFQELDSFESFYSQRNDIFLLLNNLEEDLKQATFALKALIMHNKALLKEINIKVNENKNLLNKLNFTLGENENLKLKLNEQNDNINFNFSCPIDIASNNNNLNNNNNIKQIKIDDEEEYEEPKVKNLDIKDNNIMNENEILIDNNFDRMNKYEQLSNVKNIIKDMRNNKKNLKLIIEQHFNEEKIGK